MKAKKLFALLIAGAMVITTCALAACQNNNPGPGPDPDPGPGPGPGPSTSYTLDTHEYHLVGNGAGDLKQNNWTPSNHDLMFVRDEEADHNKFDITIDMYGNDAFKVLCEDDDYDGPNQYRVYSMEGYADGIVTDEDGNTVFSEGEFGNIVLEVGNDGTYTFSLHTFPDGEKDTYISFTKDGELKALLDMYVVSDMNDFGLNQKAYAKSHMTKSDSGWKAMLTVEETDLVRDADGELVAAGEQGLYVAVAVRNDVADETGYQAVTCDTSEKWETKFIDGDEYNLLPAGVYTLIYNAEEDTLTITEGAFEVYFIGSFSNWEVKPENKLTEDVNGNWYGYLTITEDDYVDEQDYAEVKLRNPLASTGGWYSNNGEANMQLTAGEYFFRFTTAEEKVEYEECAYYIAGNIENTEWGVAANSPKLEWNAESGVYTVEIDTAGGLFKVVYGSVLGGVKVWYPDGMGTDIPLAEGAYIITFDPKTEVVTPTEAVSEVTVTFDLNLPDEADGSGLTTPDAQTINRRATATKPQPDPELAGYIFTGWYTDEECKHEFDFATPVTGNMTLYAGWLDESELPANPTITFDLNYTGAPEAQVVDTVDGLISSEDMPANPTRSGYYFLGWYTSEAGTTEFNFKEAIISNKTAYAKWVEIDTHQWHIVGTNISGIDSWNPGDKGLSFVHDDEYNDNIFVIVVELTTSAQFKILGVDGWSQGFEVKATNIVGGDGKLGGSDNITVSVAGIYMLTLTVHSSTSYSLTYTTEIPQVTVSFDLNLPAEADGNELTAPATQTINKSAKPTVPADELTLEGYNFIGWYYDEECTKAFNFTTKAVTVSITLYAKWEKIVEGAEYDVTFDLNYDGADNGEPVKTEGGKVTKPAEPTRDGYFFMGWYKDDDCTEEFDFDADIITNTTVYAKWSEKDMHVWHIVGEGIDGVDDWIVEDETLELTHDDELYPKQNVFTITLTLNEGAAFKILGVNEWMKGFEVTSGDIVNGDGKLAGSGNIEVKATGIYTLILTTENNGTSVKLTYTYSAAAPSSEKNVEANAVEAEVLTYWVVGTFIDSEGNVKYCEIVEGLTPKMTLGEDGMYTVEFEVKDVTSNFDWIASDGPEGAIFAIQVVYGSVLGGIKEWGSGNTYAKEGEGTYTVTYDAALKTTTLTKKAA